MYLAPATTLFKLLNGHTYDNVSILKLPILSGIYMYFLNSQNRDHKKLYGPDAFYDLDNHGHQAKLATDLLPGDTCVVISYEDKSRNVVQISSYKFLQERSAYDEHGMICRVFDGVLKGIESLLKTDAAKDPKFARFFNIKGHFKQFSVMA